ncbi:MULTISPECIES: hypothetical protein [unclassified Microbacterium]|nr:MULTISPECIES: hypothetical protein [unclassified Microbacterium]MCR2808535.1 hypothetical protein [Microbacterium sp. zg.B185]WIM19025.1 hypothetical protein QNO12_15810 [Microbacterium sp. zg-B185]
MDGGARRGAAAFEPTAAIRPAGLSGAVRVLVDHPRVGFHPGE